MYPQLNPDTTSASNQSGGDSNTQAQLYDTVGRRYYIGTTVGFGGR